MHSLLTHPNELTDIIFQLPRDSITLTANATPNNQDVTEFYAHRFVIYTKCPPLAQLVYQQQQSIINKENNNNIITSISSPNGNRSMIVVLISHPNATAATFQLLLRFLYLDELTDSNGSNIAINNTNNNNNNSGRSTQEVKPEDLADLFALADHFQLSLLSEV